MYILPNVLNKLEDIKSIKQDINRALINQGQNMNNISFKDFPEKVDNLKCNLSYVKFNIQNDIVDLDKSFSMFKLNLFTSTQSMFYNCYGLKNISNFFDTSNVTNMSNMFGWCSSLIEISNFNTSNVIDMSYIFSNCVSLIMVPNFDTSNVTNMSNMFYKCSNLTSIPNFDTSNVINISSMLWSCHNLTSIPNFDTSNVTNMAYMFRDCTNLTIIPQFNTSKVTSISGMARGCNNLSDKSIQNIINMCLNSNIVKAQEKNLNTKYTYSVFNGTIFNSSYYSNRLAELTDAGWKY